jgi:hypothetical protein
MLGTGLFTLKGSTGVAANVIVTTAADTMITDPAAVWRIRDFSLRSTGGSGLIATDGAVISYQNIAFGACSTYQMSSSRQGIIICTGNYEINGNAIAHHQVFLGGVIQATGVTVTLTGTPAYTLFAQNLGGIMELSSNTYTGAATGSRFNSQYNGAIRVSGAGANYLPGNTAGTTVADQEYA